MAIIVMIASIVILISMTLISYYISDCIFGCVQKYPIFSFLSGESNDNVDEINNDNVDENNEVIE